MRDFFFRSTQWGGSGLLCTEVRMCHAFVIFFAGGVTTTTKTGKNRVDLSAAAAKKGGSGKLDVHNYDTSFHLLHFPICMIYYFAGEIRGDYPALRKRERGNAGTKRQRRLYFGVKFQSLLQEKVAGISHLAKVSPKRCWILLLAMAGELSYPPSPSLLGLAVTVLFFLSHRVKKVSRRTRKEANKYLRCLSSRSSCTLHRLFFQPP